MWWGGGRGWEKAELIGEPRQKQSPSPLHPANILKSAPSACKAVFVKHTDTSYLYTSYFWFIGSYFTQALLVQQVSIWGYIHCSIGAEPGKLPINPQFPSCPLQSEAPVTAAWSHLLLPGHWGHLHLSVSQVSCTAHPEPRIQAPSLLSLQCNLAKSWHLVMKNSESNFLVC